MLTSTSHQTTQVTKKSIQINTVTKEAPSLQYKSKEELHSTLTYKYKILTNFKKKPGRS